MEKLNPATSAPRPTRIPWNLPVSKLGVPEIPGYNLRWFRDDPVRVQRALAAGWEWVDSKEIQTAPTALGSGTAEGSNLDLGSRVAVAAGEGSAAEGQPGRLLLLKQKKEVGFEEAKLKAERNEQVAAAIRGGNLGESERGNDPGKRYLDKKRTSIPDLFKPKQPRAA